MNPARNKGTQFFLDSPPLHNSSSSSALAATPSSLTTTTTTTTSTSSSSAPSQHPQFNPGFDYYGMSRNMCLSPEVFKERNPDYLPSRQSKSSLVSNTAISSRNDKDALARASLPTKSEISRDPTTSSSLLGNDLQILSDSTLYSHAPPHPHTKQQDQRPQHHASRGDNKETGTRKPLGFLRSNSNHQGDLPSISSTNNNNQQQQQQPQQPQKGLKEEGSDKYCTEGDDFLYRHSQSSTSTIFLSSTVPTVSAAPSFRSIFSASANHPISSSSTAKKRDDRIVVEDWLQKRSSSLQLVWRRRWCVLKDDGLFFYRSNIDLKPLGVLHLADYALLTSGPELSRKSKLAFRLSLTASPAVTETTGHIIGSSLGTSSSGATTTTTTQEKNQQAHHLFHAETQQALDLWLEAIQSHIDHAHAHQYTNNRADIGNGSSSSRASSLDQSNSNLTYGYRIQNYHRQHGEDQGGQSIIDKVLDRLLLEDPTLSDMNDPSTLIMPAQEHPSSAESVRSLHMCVDDSLDAWSATSSPFLYSREKNNSNGSTRSAIASSANTSMSLETNKFNNSYGIHSSNNNIAGRSGQHLQHPSADDPLYNGGWSYSSSQHSHSAASSYAGFSDMGTGSKQHRPASIASTGTHENSGKTLSGHRHHQGSHLFSGSRNQQPLVLQIPGSVTLPYRPNGLSHSTSSSSANSPVSSPKLGIYSPTNSAFSPTSLTSPEYFILKVDNSNLNLNRSSNSIATSESSSGEGSTVTATVIENGLALAHDEKNRGFNPSSPIHYGANQDLSPAIIKEKEAMAKATMVSSPKKVKKLWSAYGSAEPTALAFKANGSQVDHSGSSSSGGRRSSRTTTSSQALEASNPLLRGLVLVDSAQSLKKSGGRSSSIGSNCSKSGSVGKGGYFSKSMTSLSKKEDDYSCWDPFSASATIQQPPLPLVGTRSSSSSSALSPSRTRTASVSIADEKVAAKQQQQQQKQQHRQYYSDCIKPSIGNILFSALSTPPQPKQQQQQRRQSSSTSLTTSGSARASPSTATSIDGTSKTGANGRPHYLSGQMRCIDPELTLTTGLQSHSFASPSATAASYSKRIYSSEFEYSNGKNPFAANVSRQIVPTDELVQAIAQETAAEELLKREQQEAQESRTGDKPNFNQKEVSNAETLPANQILLAHPGPDEQDQDSGAPAIPLRSPYRVAVLAAQK